jgi:hypothetical protein
MGLLRLHAGKVDLRPAELAVDGSGVKQGVGGPPYSQRARWTLQEEEAVVNLAVSERGRDGLHLAAQLLAVRDERRAIFDILIVRIPQLDLAARPNPGQ